jgi:hypothetical protein
MQYELTARTELSFLRFRDDLAPEAVQTLVDYLRGLAPGEGGIVIDVDGETGLSAPAIDFMRDVEERMRELQMPLRFHGIDGEAGESAPDGHRFRMSVTSH